jgi:CHAT domain-containing protein
MRIFLHDQISVSSTINSSSSKRPDRQIISTYLSAVRPIAIGLFLTTASLIPVGAIAPAQAQTLTEKIHTMETGLENEFETHFGRDLATVTRDVDDIAEILRDLGEETATNPAVLWAMPRGDHLHLVLLTGEGTPIIRDLYDVPEDLLRQVTRRFFFEVVRPRPSNFAAAQQLREWIIGTFEADYLEAQGIDSLLICLGNGLRGLPIAALYDGDRFLIEDYDLARIPAFNLISIDYASLTDANVLTMGASEFDTLSSLPAVPFELENIRSAFTTERTVPNYGYRRRPRTIQLAPEPSLLNSEFTVDHLESRLNDETFNIIHLATHALFNPGEPQDSFIQFWENAFPLSQMNDLPWDLPALDLLVLSACQTATGDDEAELGFAGLALQAGVKSAIASLWSVSDLGTSALMSELYRHLGQTTTKAGALRQAQLQLLRGNVRIEANNLVLSDTRIPLPASFLEQGLVVDDAMITFEHPFFWASFTIIGSPW